MKCYVCEEPITDDDAVGVEMKEGWQAVCQDCYFDETYGCVECEERESNHKLTHFVIVDRGAGVPPGYYEILSCPFFGGSMLGPGQVFSHAVKQVGELVGSEKENGWLCAGCVAKHGWQQPAPEAAEGGKGCNVPDADEN